MSGSYRHGRSMRRPLMHGFTTLLLLIAAAGPATAQEKSPADPETQISARGQRAASDIKYGEWQKLCFKGGGVSTLCRTSITGTFPTGQMAVRLDLIEREGDRAARLQLFVPVGMYLQVPVKLKVDDGQSYQVPYTWCLTNACIAADVADPKIVEEMHAGKTLALEVVDPNLLAVTTSVPLAQFGSVHSNVPAQTLEQNIDE